jgi:uncharacterized protein (TIGR02246 family)
MIRSLQLLAIGVALIGALTPSCLGQSTRRPLTVPVQVQSTPVETRQADAAAPDSSTMAAVEKAVRETLVAYVEAYNKKDPARIVELFTQEGTLVDSDNVATRGREAIVREFTDAFAVPSTYTLDGKTEQVRLITPDVAQAEGTSRLVSPREATIASRFVALLARKGGVWKIVEIRDYHAPTGSLKPYERLKELEWMVGDWVDESEDAQVTSSIRWGQDKAYLVRDYNVQIKGQPATSGLMIITWDPQTAQIKSWIFNADGSRGEGSWTRSADNQWVVKAHGSTGDGRATSATQVISLVNKDAIKTSSIDRVIGEEIARDIEDIIMVRKPQAPGTTPSPAKPTTPAPAALPQ